MVFAGITYKHAHAFHSIDTVIHYDRSSTMAKPL